MPSPVSAVAQFLDLARQGIFLFDGDAFEHVDAVLELVEVLHGELDHGFPVGLLADGALREKAVYLGEETV